MKDCDQIKTDHTILENIRYVLKKDAVIAG
jgi:hypothetical protein